MLLNENSHRSLMQQVNANVLRNDAYLYAIMHLHHIRYIAFSHLLQTKVLLLQPDPPFSLPFKLHNIGSFTCNQPRTLPTSADSLFLKNANGYF